MVQETFVPVRPTGKGFPSWVSKANYKVVDGTNVTEAMKELVEAQHVAWDSEYDPLHTGHLVSAFSFSTKPNTGWMIPVGMHHVPNLPSSIVRRFIFAISKKRNIVQNAGAEIRSVKALWPDEWEKLLNITDDVQVICYLKDPNEAKDFKEARPKTRKAGSIPVGFSLSAMALKYLKLEIPDLGKYFSDGNSFAAIDPEIARQYACSDVDVTLRIFLHMMDPALRDSFIYGLETRMLRILTDIEEYGILFDSGRLSEVEKLARAKVLELKDNAYELLKLDRSINIDSAAKLANHLYDVLGWPTSGKKLKTGRFSVNKQILERYADSGNPDIAIPTQALMEYRRWNTLHNNFLTKLDGYVNPTTGAIHCSLLATVVPTGRLASAGPNLQQIPRTKDVPLRRAFRARPGMLFVDVDYSQIELRVYAGETQDSYFFDAFATGEDLHLKTASVIYREEITDKSDPRRQMGKTMNFGPIYGMKPEGLAMRTDYDIYEAQRILDDFFAAMPQAKKWTMECHAKAKQMGGVHTHYGRWRPLPWLHSRIPQEVEFGERSAVNTIVQGTAADIMKIGLVRLTRALEDFPLPAHVALTVHDSFLMEVDESVDLEDFASVVHGALCFPVEGYPPLEVDMKVGRNWHDMDDYVPGFLKPEPEKFEQGEKKVTLPSLDTDQQEELLALISRVKSDSGEIRVLLDREGKEYGPFVMTGHGYTQLLQFLVAAAKRNREENGQERTTEVPKVQFA